MKKKIILFLLIVLFTGCDAVYNIDIDNNSVKETADFLYDNSAENEKIVNEYYKNNYMAFFDMDSLKDMMYKKKKINGRKKIGINLNYDYLANEYQNSSLLDQCYYKKSFIQNDDYIILYTEGGARCFYKDEDKLLDSLVININTKLKVLENNADEVKGNKYIWKLTEDNFTSKDIYIKIKRSKNKKNGKEGIIFLVIIISFIIIFAFVMIFTMFRDKKNNKL